jgi:ligand-binding SRPBCC domain-containing protein
MKIHTLEHTQRLGRPVDEVFEFFARAENLERITPPWLSFELQDGGPSELREGSLIHYRLRVHGVPLRWVSRIEMWEPGEKFVDRQLRGPYRLWRHEHTFAVDGNGAVVSDHVRYALPLGPLGDIAHAAFVHRDLGRIFDYRRQATETLLG